MQPFISTKTFRNFPCSHRQWRHAGHCRQLHGYNRSFHFWFACSSLSDTHFVMDFGGLGELRDWLSHMFDHTTLINDDDPERALFEELDRKGIIALRLMPNVSMEGTSRFVFEHADRLVRAMTQGRVWVHQVETRENDNNSALYCPSLAPVTP